VIRKLTRDALKADLAEVQGLLSSAPDEDVLGRMSLEGRRDEITAELDALASEPMAGGARPAETVLFFGGAPVVDSRGIYADFASKALSKYEDLVTKVYAVQQRGDLRPSGPVPDRRAASLHITEVVRGSFGFELAELVSPAPDVGNLADAVEEATRAMIAAAASDEDLADAAQVLGERAFAALRDFFGLLRKSAATFRVVAGDLDRTFAVEDVGIAAERTESNEVTEEDIAVDGEFLGALPEARRFEFRANDGVVIRGRVSTDLTSAELQTMNKLRAGVPSRARFHRVTLQRAHGQRTTRHTLMSLESPDDPAS
jgi:hypothetical protein